MKIAHVVLSLDPSAGGPPIVAVRLAAAQARLGHAVRIISYASPAAADRIQTMLTSIAGAELLDRREFPSPSRFERILASHARGAMPQALAQIDVVHVHGVWDPILRAAGNTAQRLQIPYVVAPHGMLDPWSLAQRRFKKRMALSLGYRSMLNHSATLHLLNRDESDLIRPLALTCPTVVIPNGIAPEEFTDLPAPGKFRAANPELGGDPYILFLGRLHYKKGLDILAEAFVILAKIHPELRLVIAGPDDGARADFQKQIGSAGLQSRVHVVGPLFGRDKYTAYRDAMCFCLPSRQEGFSMAILEAMACGLPVVISESCHFPQVAHAGAGQIVPLAAGAFAEALDRIAADPQLRSRQGIAGRETVEQNFTWPRIAQQTIETYQQLVAR